MLYQLSYTPAPAERALYRQVRGMATQESADTRISDCRPAARRGMIACNARTTTCHNRAGNAAVSLSQRHFPYGGQSR